LADKWEAPRLKRLRAEERGVTDVLFNPNALAVSGRIREALVRFPELEFLPVIIDRCGPFFIVHVTATVEASFGFLMRRAPAPSGNIVELYEFPVSYAPPTSFFRVRQPSDSAAGREGYCLPTIYTNKDGANVLLANCGTYLSAQSVDRMPGGMTP
jgi:hypothetical protein